MGVYNVTLRVSDGTGLSSIATNTFIIGAGRADGLIAVIALPNSFVPAAPGGNTTVRLDSEGTAPSPGNTLTQFVWAVISLPDKQPVANTSSASSSVQLPQGEYQVRRGASLGAGRPGGRVAL